VAHARVFKPTAIIVLMPTDRLFTKAQLVPPKSLAACNLEQVAGCLRSKRKPKTLAQMHTAVEREIVRRRDCGRY
jgi:hypothetical protein